jgi:hypothetical protein
MIGGTDIIIPTRAGDVALDHCLRVIRRYWPQAVFEDAVTGNRVELLPIGHLKEVFVHQNGAATQEWDEKGADPSLGNTMIHLLLAEGSVTVVMDDPEDEAIRPLLESLRFALHCLAIQNLSAEKHGVSVWRRSER